MLIVYEIERRRERNREIRERQMIKMERCVCVVRGKHSGRGGEGKIRWRIV